MTSPPVKVSEDAFAEQPALEWLGEVGWGYRRGPTLAPGTGSGERSTDNDVVLQQTFRAAIARLNPQLPPEAVDARCRDRADRRRRRR